jgi:hypothetical protein
MSDTNHYAVDWRYSQGNAALNQHLASPASLVWEYRSVKQGLQRLLARRKRQAYRFAASPVPVSSPNQRP